jgi:hypothetical protein
MALVHVVRQMLTSYHGASQIQGQEHGNASELCSAWLAERINTSAVSCTLSWISAAEFSVPLLAMHWEI